MGRGVGYSYLVIFYLELGCLLNKPLHLDNKLLGTMDHTQFGYLYLGI